VVKLYDNITPNHIGKGQFLNAKAGSILDANQQSVIGGSRFLTFTNGCNGSRLCENYFIIFVSGESFLKRYFYPMICLFNPPLSQKTKQTGSDLPLGFLEFEFSHSLCATRHEIRKGGL
jgi:hypothetical protein